MNIYIIPAGPNQFPKEYFKGKGISFRPYDGGSPNALFGIRFMRNAPSEVFPLNRILAGQKNYLNRMTCSLF